MDLAKDYGSVPSIESEAYVIGLLGLTTVKANVPAFMLFGASLDSKTQDTLIQIGCDFLLGKITAEQYITKYEKALIGALPKEKQKDVEFDSYTKEQIKMRIAHSHGLHSKERKNMKIRKDHFKENMELPSGKQIGEPVSLGFGKGGTLTGTVSGVHFDEGKVLYDIDIPLTDTDITTIYNVDSVCMNADIPNEPAGLQEALKNIKVKASGKEIIKNFLKETVLEEAVDYGPDIIKFVGANPHTSYGSILAHLGIDPKSGRAIPVYHAVKKALDGGQLQREKAGKSFVYSVRGTAPMPQQPVATPSTDGPKSIQPAKQVAQGTTVKDQILDIIKKSPNMDASQVVTALGITPGSPKQIPIFKVMRDMIISGELLRTQEGKKFKYSIGNGTPVVLPTKPKGTAPTSNKKKEEVLKQIQNDMYSFNPGHAAMKQGPSIEGNSVVKSYRYLGNWESHTEDDDNAEWLDHRKYNKMFADWVNKHPWKKYVTVGASASEKHWAEFYVQLKTK